MHRPKNTDLGWVLNVKSGLLAVVLGMAGLWVDWGGLLEHCKQINFQIKASLLKPETELPFAFLVGYINLFCIDGFLNIIDSAQSFEPTNVWCWPEKFGKILGWECILLVN